MSERYPMSVRAVQRVLDQVEAGVWTSGFGRLRADVSGRRHGVGGGAGDRGPQREARPAGGDADPGTVGSSYFHVLEHEDIDIMQPFTVR